VKLRLLPRMLFLFQPGSSAFAPNLRPDQARLSHASRAAILCTLDAPLPPATVSAVEVRAAAVADEVSASILRAASVADESSSSIFPTTNMLAANVLGFGKEFSGYKDRSKPNEFIMPAEQEKEAKDEAPAKTDYKSKYSKRSSESIDLSSYFEDTPGSPPPPPPKPAPAPPASPKFEAPKFEAPKFDAPKFEKPTFKLPDAPKFEKPSFKLPDAPKLSVPDLPKVELPSIPEPPPPPPPPPLPQDHADDAPLGPPIAVERGVARDRERQLSHELSSAAATCEQLEGT